MNMNSIPKNRLYIRKNISKSVCFEFSTIEGGRLKKVLYDGRIENISEGGICLVTDCYFKKGKMLKLLLPFNLFSKSRPVFAEVIWSKHKDGVFKYGIKFLNNK